MRFVFLVLLAALAALGYFVWDGFFSRKLTNVEVSAGARLVRSTGVYLSFLPIDESRKYIAVYLDNPSDYIIRGATVSAQIKVKPNTTITVPNTPCVVPHSEFRVLARTATDRQTCIAMLSAEHSKLIPERDLLPGDPMKTVDLDALEFSWSLTSVEGHSQPIKILKDIADWFNNWFDKLKAPFARVNK